MKTNAGLPLRFMAVGVVAIGLAGCRRTEQAAGATAAVPAKTEAVKAAGQEEPRYPLTGEVVSADAAHKTLRVRHDEIKGFMPAMTMDFLVSAGDVAVAKPGQHIRAEMIPSKDGDFRLEKIWPDDAAEKAAIAAGARGLREDTHTRGKGAYREIGEGIPDFTLYDQEGRVIPSGHFRGKTVMMNFIFSRCPVATMCPASTLKMMAAQKLAKEAGLTKVEFVSITLDPVYDTPGVLKEYAAARGIDTGNFSFLTGPESAIRDLLAQFGVIAEFEGDLLKHTLTTLLIDPSGKIIHRADGSQWEPAEFVGKIKR